MKTHIRWMIRRDIPEVLDIEAESFDAPWSEEDFIKCLRQRNCIGMIAEFDDRVVGFFIYEFQKSSLELINFAVLNECRQQGVGRQMVEKLMKKLSSERRTHITLRIREGNLDGQLFFRACGFRAVGVERDFFQNGEAAYLMERHVAEFSMA